MTSQTDEARYQSPLGRALCIWAQGKNIPMTLAAELMAEGYDVPALERRHRGTRLS